MTRVRLSHSGAVLWPETGGIRKNGGFMCICGQEEPAPEAPEGLAVMSAYGGSEKWRQALMRGRRGQHQFKLVQFPDGQLLETLRRAPVRLIRRQALQDML